MLKDNKKLLLIFGGVGVLAVILVIVIMSVLNSSTSTAKIADEYEKLNNVASDDGKKYPRVKLPNDNRMKSVSYDDVINVFNNQGDAVIYFGYAKCLYFRTAIQVLVDTAVETELEEIYYLDVETKGDRYGELLNVLGDEFLLVDDAGIAEVHAPLVIFVVDGRIVSYNKGTLFSQEDPYTELDASQIKGLGEIYKYGINDVLNGMKNNNVGTE